MKQDFAERISEFDKVLTKKKLIGAEIGVDAGAHALALLNHTDISKLFLIDPWPDGIWYNHTKEVVAPFKNKVTTMRMASQKAVSIFMKNYFDFIYFDEHQEYEIVKENLAVWYPKLKKGGWMGIRGYTDEYPGLKRAVDEFIGSEGLILDNDGRDALWQKPLA